MSFKYEHGGNVFAIAKNIGIQVNDLIDFSASINPLGMSQKVKSSIIAALDDLVHYPDSKHDDLKQILATYHSLKPENFTIANGSTELIYNLPTVISGRKGLIISPTFGEYAKSLEQHNWELEYLTLSPETDFSIDLNELAQILSTGVDALFLCNPGNPSGKLYPETLIVEIYKLCNATDTFFVLDEAFMDFCEVKSAKKILADSDKVIILRSMTKFFAIPGLRLGYAISNQNIATKLSAIGGPWKVNTLALVAGITAVQDITHNNNTLEYIEHERSWLLEEMTKFPQLRVYETSVNYLLLEIRIGLTAAELKSILLDKYRILIRDCSGFAGLSEYFFRTAVRTSQENRKLVDSLNKIFNLNR